MLVDEVKKQGLGIKDFPDGKKLSDDYFLPALLISKYTE